MSSELDEEYAVPQRANSGSFKPGQSGNPGGAPKGYVRFAVILQKELVKTDRRNKPHLEAIAEKVVKMAMAGDMDAIRWLADRVDGKVAQTLDVNSTQTVNVVPWLPAAMDAAQRLSAAPELEGAEVVETPGDDATESRE